MAGFDDLVRHAVLRALELRAGQPSPARALEGWYPARPLLLAHRGDRAHFPENTVPSVREAMRRGADGAEFDVRLSKDGVPVVIHDATVDRTMHASGRVRDFSAAELGLMTARRHLRWGDGPRVGVPTLHELLAAFPDGAVAVVELKGPAADQPTLEARSLEAMKPHRGRLRFIASSFHPPQLLELRRLDSTLPLGVLAEPEQILPLRAGIHTLPLRPAALHLPFSMVNRELLRLTHKAGMRVHAWRVMTAAEVSALVDVGVDAIMVDDVPAGLAALERALAARPAAMQRPMPVKVVAGS